MNGLITSPPAIWETRNCSGAWLTLIPPCGPRNWWKRSAASCASLSPRESPDHRYEPRLLSHINDRFLQCRPGAAAGDRGAYGSAGLLHGGEPGRVPVEVHAGEKFSGTAD